MCFNLLPELEQPFLELADSIFLPYSHKSLPKSTPFIATRFGSHLFQNQKQLLGYFTATTAEILKPLILVGHILGGSNMNQ